SRSGVKELPPITRRTSPSGVVWRWYRPPPFVSVVAFASRPRDVTSNTYAVSGARFVSVIAWLVTRFDVFASRVRDAAVVPYRTSVVAGSFVAQAIVALIALVSTTATSWIVGPLARIWAVAVAVWAGDRSWYEAVMVSPSRTWRIPSVTALPKAVRIEPRQISSAPPLVKVVSSPAGSIPDATCTRTEVAEESWTVT